MRNGLVLDELFAGSANLSKAFRAIGMQVIPVDTKDAAQVKMVKLNLLHSNSVQMVLRLLETRKVVFVHMAPPCSTSLKALPFGATGSVQGFCRCSVALWALVLHYVLVPITVFFDDYTSVVSALDSSSSEAAFVLLMRILGWKVAADKGQPFPEPWNQLPASKVCNRSCTS